MDIFCICKSNTKQIEQEKKMKIRKKKSLNNDTINNTRQPSSAIRQLAGGPPDGRDKEQATAETKI
jgi:hypothetical protein